jgi:hypothetical protein
MIRIKAFALATFIAIAFTVPARSEPIGASRSEMLDAAQREILSRSALAVPPASLGDWKTVTDAACFALFRKTELHRGPMRLIVVSSREIEVTLYPDGTLLATTGLFDYADDLIFERDALSPRRMRNISAEREEIIAPFIAYEAAKFALDLGMKAWDRSSRDSASDGFFASRGNNTPEECLKADRFAAILMATASYPKRSYEAWLSGFAETVERASSPTIGSGQQNAAKQGSPIERYLTRIPSVTDRLASLVSTRVDIEKAVGELGAVLDGIRTATALKESVSGVEALREQYRDSPYLARLEALARHELWLAGIAPAEAILKTVLPIARRTEYSPGIESWFSKTDGASADALPENRATPPGNLSAYALAVDAYRRALSVSTDPTLESAYATLLAYSGNRDSRAEAVRLAAEAASSESGGSAFVSRANYAAILFLTGIDRIRAVTLLGKLASEASLEHADAAFIPAGFPGDGRDLALNLALMYRLSGNAGRSSAAVSRFLVPEESNEAARISWRRVRIGDSADELTALWGEPEEISYSYYTETWSYPKLFATVSVADSDSGRSVKAIRIGPNSPLSPGEDIRVGDTRASFEAAFGKPLWYADDAAVYRKGKDAIAVEYLGARIRSILAWSE